MLGHAAIMTHKCRARLGAEELRRHVIVTRAKHRYMLRALCRGGFHAGGTQGDHLLVGFRFTRSSVILHVESTKQALALEAAVGRLDGAIVAEIATARPPLNVLQSNNVVGEGTGRHYSRRRHFAYRTRNLGWSFRALERFLCTRLANRV